MSITYRENDKAVDYAQVTELLAGTIPARKDWSPEKVKNTFENSTYTIVAQEGDQVVAAAHVLSDGYEWALLGDLAVHPSYQGQGIGETLLKKILEAFRGQEIFTYTYLDEISFFEKYGFRRSKNAFTYAGEEDEFIQESLLDQGFFLPVGYKYESDYYKPVGNFPVGAKSVKKLAETQIRYTDQLDEVDFKELNDLLGLAFGHDKDLEVTIGAFTRSQYFSFAFDHDRLIGCARAMSDGNAQGFILNVAVDPSYQGLHLGWNIVSKLSEQMKGQNVFLNTHPGGVGFYNRKGFRRNKTALLLSADPDMPQEIAYGFTLPKGFRFADEF